MLLLVDGARTVESVLHLSLQAGVPASCLNELISLGLVVVPQSMGMRWTTAVIDAASSGTSVSRGRSESAAAQPAARQPAQPDSGFVDADTDVFASCDEAADREVDADPLPTTTLPDTEFGVSTVVTDSVLDESDDGGFLQNPLEEARELLVHAVTTEAPVAGALTLMRLKRARTPMDLLALIHEVEARINRPHRAMATQQLMGRVAQLLSQAEALHATSDTY